jgi:hypothetical protein
MLRLYGAAATALTLAVDRPCQANGRFPAATQLVFAPADSGLVALGATYGILLSRDEGASWSYICEDVIGISPSSDEDPALAVMADRTIVAGDYAGLSASADLGCNWTCQGGPLTALPVVDLAVRPNAPDTAVALVSAYEVSDSSAYNIRSLVFETTDDGRSWGLIGSPLPNDLVVSTIDVAKPDPARLYVSGVRGVGSTASAWLYISTDRATTWSGFELPAVAFDPTQESGVYIGGVDPQHAGRLYVRSKAVASGGRSRLTAVDVISDGTPTFRSLHAFDVGPGPDFTGEMLGFALAPDGSEVYVGSENDGLWAASSNDFAFRQRSSIPITCLATRGAELWACSVGTGGFVLGASSDDGVTFTPKLSTVGALTGPRACAPDVSGAGCGASQNASQCVVEWDQFCTSFPCGVDGGGFDGSGIDGASSPLSEAAPSPPRASSCGVAGAPRPRSSGDGPSLLVVAVGVAAASVRGRRRRGLGTASAMD